MSVLTCRSCLFLVLLQLGVINLSLSAAEPGAERAPQRMESKADEVINFSLLDYKGKHHELRRSEARVVVMFFTSFGCPIARQSLPKLKALRKQFSGRDVALWLVNSSPQEDPDDITVQMLVGSRKNRLGPEPARVDLETARLELLKSAVGDLPVLRDELQLVARRFGVTRTCDVIAIDPKTSTIIYRGAIDDQLTE